MRRATVTISDKTVQIPISIHALREEGDFAADLFAGVVLISIHALREEGDKHGGAYEPNSRLISIHALREEGDGLRIWSSYQRFYFYPRPP